MDVAMSDEAACRLAMLKAIEEFTDGVSDGRIAGLVLIGLSDDGAPCAVAGEIQPEALAETLRELATDIENGWLEE